MLIDTHCHLNFEAFEKDLDDVVRHAKEEGVGKIIIPGTDMSSSRRAVAIAQKYPGTCFAAVGIHPHHAHDKDLVVDDNVRHVLGELLEERGVVAMGEIGLDHYRYTKTKYQDTEVTEDIKQKQKELFLLQLHLAVIHNKPVILHCREAYADMIQTISTFSRSNSSTSSVKTNYIKPHHLRGIFHCFSGSTQDLQVILTMGYYVGFDGNITYNKDQYSPLVRSAPLNRILLETDAPFLTPIPHRGTRNTPAYLSYVAQAVADYHSTPLSEVTDQTGANATSLFGLN